MRASSTPTRNFCLHQGGPACEGLTIAKVEERLRPDKTSMGLYFSETEMHFVCPWHGMEYDMKTGECVSRPAHEAEEISGRAEGRRGLCPRLRRAAKDAARARGQSRARARGPPSPPAKPSAKAANAASAEAKRLAAAIERGIADGRLDMLTPEALQALIAAACRLYAARREAGEEFTPVAKNSLAATDVMVTASGLLQAANLAVFELGMWQGWTGR